MAGPGERAGRQGLFGLGGTGASPIPVFVMGVGLRCALGLSALQAAMLMRARMGEPRATRFLDKRGRFVGVHAAPGIPADLHGVERMIALSAPALRAAVGMALGPSARASTGVGGGAGTMGVAPMMGVGGGAGTMGVAPMMGVGGESARWPVFLAAPEKGRADDDGRFDGAIVAAIAEAAHVAVDVGRSRAIRAGHAGVAIAVAAALEEIARGAPAVVVGGVDSYFHPDVLAWLDEEHRLHALDAENGFVPGEGAAFFVLGPKLGGAAPVSVRRAVVGREETVLGDEPNIGASMTGILRELCASAPGERLAWSMSDVNAERHRVREWGLASGRGAFADDTVHDRPVDDLGDLGAASGAVFAALACELYRVGGAKRSSVCVALASDGAERGAFLLAHEGGTR